MKIFQATWKYLDSLGENSQAFETLDASERSQSIATPLNRARLINTGEIEEIIAG